jgi:hypothetical protein
MIKTFTQTDLIRYIYRETSEEETKEINKALICDSELQLQFRELSSLTKEIDETRMQPSSATIANILHYAKGMQEKR